MYSFQEREQLWIEAGGNPAFAAIAAAISMAENGSGDPSVVSPTNDVGLWQVNLDAHPQYTRQWLSDPLNNARAAVNISDNGENWNPWVTYKSGAYQQYLSGGPTLLASQQRCGLSLTLPGIPIPGGGQIGQSQICMDAPLGIGAIIVGALLLVVGVILLGAFAVRQTEIGRTIVRSTPVGRLARG